MLDKKTDKAIIDRIFGIHMYHIANIVDINNSIVAEGFCQVDLYLIELSIIKTCPDIQSRHFICILGCFSEL